MTYRLSSLLVLSLFSTSILACSGSSSSNSPATEATPGSGGSSASGGSGGSEGLPSGGATATSGGATNASGGMTAGGGAPTTGSGGGNSSSDNGAPEGSPVHRFGKLQVSGSGLADEQGSPVQLNGPSSMWLNWDDANYATNFDGLKFMRDEWGMEVFRIAMGIEPQDAYLDDQAGNKAKVRTIVDNAIQLGVYVIIDWHDHNAEEHQNEATEFFAEMAQTYGDSPNVLYEVYNEPLDISWSSVLKPYHESLIGTIRQHDPDNVIILGTPKWSQDVDVAALDPVSGSNLIYTLHFYACEHTDWLREKADEALTSGIPLFVTEWGATAADGGVNGTVCETEAEAWHNWMDQHGVSWTAWKLDGCTDSTCYFVDREVSPSGGWTDANLNGHAPFVIEKMKK